MFPQSARYYDAIYAFKDYGTEAARLHALIRRHKQAPGNALLDAGCGTGIHVAFLRHFQYQVEGLDLDPDLLAIARERYPAIPFHQGDMASFELDHQVDVATCLFSAIGYVKTGARLRQTVATLARHVRPGGLVIVEPWFTPENAARGAFAPSLDPTPDGSIARMTVNQVEDTVSVLTFHFLVQTPEGVEYFHERHELGLFTSEEYTAAFTAAGLEVTHDPEGLIGRGLYIGLKPPG